MSLSNIDMLSNNETAAKVAPSSDNVEAEMHHVTTLVKALKDGAEIDASYEAILKTVMGNAKSRDALMKAMRDNTKLSQFVVADFPKAVEITSDFQASAAEPPAVVKKLTPPFGTKGFSNEVYQVNGTDWILDVYAYRHANSNNVTVIVLHSGSISGIMVSCILWTTPATAHKFQYPTRHDSELGDGQYSYHIDYTHNINMIGPDGRNPIPIELIYTETIIAQKIGFFTDPSYLGFSQLLSPGRIYGASVFNTSFEVGTSIFIELVYDSAFPSYKRTGRIEVSV